MATIKQAQQPPTNMKDLVPVYAAAPVSGPPVDNEFTGLSQTSIGPVPGVLTTTYDSVRQWTRPGTAQFRTFPLPPRSNPQINSIVNSAIANIPASVVVSSGMVFKGDWESFIKYNINDVVIFNKSAYIALSSSLDVQPNGDSDPPQWKLLSENFVFNPTVAGAGFYGTFDTDIANTNGGGTSSTMTVGPVTPAAAGEIALVIGSTSTGAIGTPSGWQVLDNSSAAGSSMGAYVQIQSSGAPFSFSKPLGSSLSWDIVLALFSSTITSFTANITKVAVASNIVTVTCANDFVIGTIATCTGLSGIMALNGVALTILTVSSTQFTAAFTHADYGPSADSGTATDVGIVQVASSTPGNTSGPSLSFTNPVTPGNTVIAMLCGVDSGGFGSGYSDIQNMGSSNISPSSWTIINSQASTGNKPHANLAYVQNVTGGDTVQAVVQNSVLGARFVIIELSGSIAQYLPYDVLDFNGNKYVCLDKTSQTPTGDPSSWYLLVDHRFSAITSGTNTRAAMVVGSGASIDYTGTGSIDANELMTTDLRTTGGAHEVLKQLTSGGPITVATIATADLPAIWNFATKTTTYALVADDYILADTSGGIWTATLPAASANTGKMIGIKKITSDSNTLTIARTGSDTIDGATSQSITTQWLSFIFASNGTNWYIVDLVSTGGGSSPTAVNLTTQTANVAATTALAVTTAGIYRVSVYLVVSQAASSSSALPDSRIIFTDRDSGATITVPITAGITTNTTSTFAQATFILNAKASTNIQYDIGQVTPYASVGGTPMQFAYRLRIEAL